MGNDSEHSFLKKEISMDHILDRDVLRKMKKICSDNSIEDIRYNLYRDPENRLKIYLESVFDDLCEFRSYELRVDKGVFLLITIETSDIDNVQVRNPDETTEVAGFNETAATGESEAIEYLISMVAKEIIDDSDGAVDTDPIKASLRKTLLPKQKK
jgi:hypothetical protein